jgi:D-arabinose 1-dehydrogenase-like Zn-dependent alcohol dehydrogenase
MSTMKLQCIILSTSICEKGAGNVKDNASRSNCEGKVTSLVARDGRQLNLYQFNEPYELCERPIPKCGEHDLLIEVRAAGFCHSDLQVLHGQFPASLPMIPSHEPAGKITQIGSNVSGPWKIGDRVGILNFKNACGQCVGCKQHKRRSDRPDPRFCQQREMAGFKHDGAFAQFMLADPNTTVHLPSQVSYEQGAPLMCAGVSTPMLLTYFSFLTGF